MPTVDVQQAIELREQGLSYRQIGLRLGGFTKQAIANVIKTHRPDLRVLPKEPLKPCSVPWCKRTEAPRLREGLCGYHHQVKRDKGDPCYRWERPVVTPQMRLDALREQIIERDGHWIWEGKTQSGRPWATSADFGAGRPETGVARVLYREATGEPLKRQHVYRLCDEPLCVNPAHHTHGKGSRK